MCNASGSPVSLQLAIYNIDTSYIIIMQNILYYEYKEKIYWPSIFSSSVYKYLI